MTYQSKATDLIRKRTSWRSYGKQAVAEETRARFDGFIEGLGKPFWGTEARFELVEIGEPGAGRIAGTYGMIRGAGIYVVGSIVPGPHDMEDFGYLFEQIILYATDLELGTCWMGVTFDRGSLVDKLGLSQEERIPAVSPLGHPANRRGVFETVARATVSASKRKPWKDLFFDGGWDQPLGQDAAGAYEVPLEMLRLGPSASNKQPWRIVRADDAFHLYLQRSKGYRKIGGATDMQRIDMGIAMLHFELAAKELGLAGAWSEADPGLAPLPQRTEYVVSWLERK